MSNVLITGGSGMIGKRLSQHLIKKGYSVSIVSRSKKSLPKIKSYRWDLKKNEIDHEALKNADHLIHLAGAGIADQRWTESRKKEIYDSRILSTRLLVNELNKQNHHVKSFISTSAIGIYGGSKSRLMKEEDFPAHNFLAKVCAQWEKETNQLTNPNVRLVIPRIGIVLSLDGGALPELNKTTKFGFASYLGTGKQFYSWIHIDDLCKMLIYMMEEDAVQGVYNAVAPSPVTNKELVKEIVKSQNRKALIIPAPQIALELILGEMSDMILNTQNCDSKKIENAGFKFDFRTVDQALKDLFS